jgi:hypothetical protein
VFVCMKCVRPIVFGPDGWVHLYPSTDCVSVVVAWPPAVTDEDEHGLDAA